MPSQPAYRYLRGYTLDPGFSTQLDTMGINHTIYRIRWEDLANSPGPSGEYFEVIDIDPSSDCYYEPVDLNSVEVLSQNGLSPSEGNPQFHQQFVYTIAMKVLDHFEQSLGRKIIWNPRPYRKGYSTENKDRYVDKIRIYPHALREANAFYSLDKKALLFGYFKALPQIQGTNFPGGAVFTCLSPDIIAHETTHALLDSIHPRFIENTNPDVPAFHEGFADIVALLQRFTINNLVESQITRTQGQLDKEFNFLGEMATQFGNALAHGRGALRSAIGKFNEKNGHWEKILPDPLAYSTVFDPHSRGAILVATFFDAFLKVYSFKTQDLIRIASNGSGILPQGSIHPDLVKRLATEICKISNHLLHIAIRALDYCPPLDITFGDYMRALVTADMDFAPADDNNYRVALIDAFRSWGIFPDRVNTLSEESLQWTRPETFNEKVFPDRENTYSEENLQESRPVTFNKQETIALQLTAERLRGHIRTLLDLRDRRQIYRLNLDIQADLNDFLKETKKEALGADVWAGFLNKLGLSAVPIKFNYPENQSVVCENLPIEVHKIQPAHRIGQDGSVLEQAIVTLTQTARVKERDATIMKFRGGCTIVLNLSDDCTVDYIVVKSIYSQRRFKAQWDYQLGKDSAKVALSDSIYDDDNGFQKINFAKLHFHESI